MSVPEPQSRRCILRVFFQDLQNAWLLNPAVYEQCHLAKKVDLEVPEGKMSVLLMNSNCGIGHTLGMRVIRP